ncbi:hypothetical protein QBC37DRAFT_480948 [Rhypophila decipiens]|uniref:Uncharacterized protein n=1 Tax=Rhypophila decipiens TaxID=261697 RepID=A0AAN7B9Y7_9PEZI|nr:hypothetical protein QBC37DRAFT_480948 [Rhypophila decipiens]
MFQVGKYNLITSMLAQFIPPVCEFYIQSKPKVCKIASVWENNGADIKMRAAFSAIQSSNRLCFYERPAVTHSSPINPYCGSLLAPQLLIARDHTTHISHQTSDGVRLQPGRTLKRETPRPTSPSHITCATAQLLTSPHVLHGIRTSVQYQCIRTPVWITTPPISAHCSLTWWPSMLKVIHQRHFGRPLGIFVYWHAEFDNSCCSNLDLPHAQAEISAQKHFEQTFKCSLCSNIKYHMLSLYIDRNDSQPGEGVQTKGVIIDATQRNANRAIYGVRISLLRSKRHFHLVRPHASLHRGTKVKRQGPGIPPNLVNPGRSLVHLLSLDSGELVISLVRPATMSGFGFFEGAQFCWSCWPDGQLYMYLLALTGHPTNGDIPGTYSRYFPAEMMNGRTQGLGGRQGWQVECRTSAAKTNLRTVLERPF